MSSRGEIVKRVDDAIRQLSRPLGGLELASGWTEPGRIAMLRFFELLREDLINDVDVRSKPQYLSITRGMDHWGVVDGEILRQAGEISAKIKSLQ